MNFKAAPVKQEKIEKVIGIISDTHGLLRPEAIAALRGVDLILHAGDVGNSEVLETLKEIAPIVAVRGNNDRGDWADRLPHWEVTEVGAINIYMIHDVKEMDLSPAAAGFQVVVSGHSHKPSVEERQGVLYVNPGSAGPRRFSLPVSVARLRVSGKLITAEVINLFESSLEVDGYSRLHAARQCDPGSRHRAQRSRAASGQVVKSKVNPD